MNFFTSWLRKLLPVKRMPEVVVRGRVDPTNPDVIGNGAFKAKARPLPTCKYRVHRAATNSWEDFKDAQVKG